MVKPLESLVPVSSTPHNAYTPGLSTSSSWTVLTESSSGKSCLRGGFPLRCFQRLSLSEHSYRAMQLASQPEHQRFVHSGPLVLGAALFKFPTSTADRDRTVSRRSKPSSRTALNGRTAHTLGTCFSPRMR